MKKSFVIFLALALLVISSCNSIANKPYAENAYKLHNTVLGKDISLGQSKDEIDKILGNSVLKESKYYYTDYNTIVTYNEGKAFEISITDKNWIFMGSIKVSSDTTELHGRFGTQYNKEFDDIAIYCYFNSDSNLVSKNQDPVIEVIFGKDNDSSRVSSITTKLIITPAVTNEVTPTVSSEDINIPSVEPTNNGSEIASNLTEPVTLNISENDAMYKVLEGVSQSIFSGQGMSAYGPEHNEYFWDVLLTVTMQFDSLFNNDLIVESDGFLKVKAEAIQVLADACFAGDNNLSDMSIPTEWLSYDPTSDTYSFELHDTIFPIAEVNSIVDCLDGTYKADVYVIYPDPNNPTINETVAYMFTLIPSTKSHLFGYSISGVYDMGWIGDGSGEGPYVEPNPSSEVYVVQAGSFTYLTDAERKLAEIESKLGLFNNGYISFFNDWYVVFFGDYSTREEAEHMCKLLVDSGIEALVRKM